MLDFVTILSITQNPAREKENFFFKMSKRILEVVADLGQGVLDPLSLDAEFRHDDATRDERDGRVTQPSPTW